MRHLALLSVLLTFAIAVSTVTADEYVVHQNHPQATDENAGTLEAPLKTISKGVSMAKAGDTVTVKAGTYPEKVVMTASGEMGKPITLKAAPGERVVLKTGDRRCGITWAAGIGHLVIDGFEVRGGGIAGNEGGIGSADKGGHHVTIQNCILVDCGILLMGQSDCVVRRCIQTGCTKNGVSLTGCSRCTVEECEIFSNGADGLVVAWDSHDCRVLRNYIHDHWYDKHPDALQIYHTVNGLTVEGNLLFNSGQGFMMQGSDGGVFRNNIICGTHHSGILLGHRSTHNWTVEQNTIAYTAFKALVFSGSNTVIRNNILVTGADRKLIEKAGPDPCRADYNLLWKPEGHSVVYHVPEDQAEHSQFADPQFRGAPPLTIQGVYYIDKWGDEEAPGKCTNGTFCIGRKGMPDQFQVGDHIELNFDRVVRKVTGVSEDSVSFTPPLEKLHHHGWDVVVNWKDATEFAWDLRPAEGSPAVGMGDRGQDVGSSINMQAYMKGDFDGDGQRDLPPVPED